MYITTHEGSGPVLITVPHDGSLVFPDKPVRDEILRWQALGWYDVRDNGTLPIAQRCSALLDATVVAVDVHRQHVDVNRCPISQPFVAGFDETYEAFHGALHQQIQRIARQHDRCLLIDLHGYQFSPGPELYDVVLGTDGHRTARGFDTQLQAALQQRRLRVVFSPDPARAVRSCYRGGWIVRSAAARYAAQWRFDAVQVELNAHLRCETALTQTAEHLAHAIETTF